MHSVVGILFWWFVTYKITSVLCLQEPITCDANIYLEYSWSCSMWSWCWLFLFKNISISFLSLINFHLFLVISYYFFNFLISLSIIKRALEERKSIRVEAKNAERAAMLSFQEKTSILEVYTKVFCN